VATSQRVVKTASALAGETVAAVGEMSAAVAEVIVATGRSFRGKKAIAPSAGLVGIALGVPGVVEWPIAIAASGASLIVGRVAIRRPRPPAD
jgi:hypothetical protein